MSRPYGGGSASDPHTRTWERESKDKRGVPYDPCVDKRWGTCWVGAKDLLQQRMEDEVGVVGWWPDPAEVATMCLAVLQLVTAGVLFRDLQMYFLVATLVFIAFNKVEGGRAGRVWKRGGLRRCYSLWVWE